MKEKLSSNFVIIIPCLVILFNMFLVLNPAEMIAAAREGLLLWFNQVLPSLLPFVVGANLLAGLGFIRFLGVLAAPLMIPLFKVPGAGAFALLTGLSSGYPMGAKAVAHLRMTRQIRQQEAQRLLAFSNNAGPLFIVGFVGTGLFGSARIGYILLASHIVAAFIVGLIYRFFGEKTEVAKGGLKRAFEEFHSFRQTEYEGFGSVFGASVKNAMETMVLIGGFIIFFSVLIKTFEMGGLFGLFGNFTGLIAGVIEVANGARIIAQAGAQNPAAVIFAAALISFGGLSVHSQTAHFLRGTDIKFLPYLFAKVLQAVVSAVICLILIKPFF